jgi:DnaJ-class molecular chaperone
MGAHLLQEKFKSHYQTLEVIETASIEAIKGAYKQLSQKWHPDKNLQNKEEAEHVIKKINEAYAVLSDSIKKTRTR